MPGIIVAKRQGGYFCPNFEILSIIRQLFLKITCFFICLFLSDSIHLFAKSNFSDGGSGSGLQYPLLVRKFYEANNEKLFWFAAANDLRTELLSQINEAASLGLDKNKYHLAQLEKNAGYTIPDSLKLQELDKIYTDAFISFCKDIYEGREINKVVSFDELSAKNENKDDEYLLASIWSVKTRSDIDSLINTLQPCDTYYQTLRSELKTQIQLKDNSKTKQLCNALNLYRWVHHFNFDKYILINIGSTTLWYYEHDTEKLSSKIIVGKPSTRTPRFAAHCEKVIFYPYWNVPRDIVGKELLPKFKRSPAALASLNMEVIDRKGQVVNPYSIKWSQYNKANFPYNIRQSTGCDNSLGVIKFDLTDPFSVYLHDTNAKKLFASKLRYFSHGCIRIEKAIELGNYFLKDKIDDAYLTSCMKDQKPIETKLERSIPVFVVYSTAEVGMNGLVQYYRDIYNQIK